jgi:hypothetical protein
VAATWTWIPLSAAPIYNNLGLDMNGTDTHRTRTINLSDIPDTNFAQNDTGRIRINYNGKLDSFTLYIIDTLDYDTTDGVVIYPAHYSWDTASIESYYMLHTNTTNYYPAAGDTMIFWPMFFDFNKSENKFLGTGQVSWELNSTGSVSSGSFTATNTTAYVTDVLVAAYVNAFGQTLRDTVRISWQPSPNLRMGLESAPGQAGQAPQYITDTIVIDTSVHDTLFQIYAVIRDEFENFVSNDDYENWTMAPDQSAYVDIPNVTTSLGWILKKANPAQEIIFNMIATGISAGGIGDQKDTAVIKIVNYAYDLLQIFTVDDISGQGYSAGDSIPRGAVINLQACGISGRFEARARHDDSLFDSKVVEWRVTNDAPFSAGKFPDTTQIILVDPIAEVTLDTLIATFTTGTGLILRDTLVFKSDPPYVVNVQLDSTRNLSANLQEIIIQGDTAQIHAGSFWLYAMGNYNCVNDPPDPVKSNWSTPGISNPWFSTMVSQLDAESVFVDLSGFSKYDSIHGSIRIDYPPGPYYDIISFRIIDTTNYDTLDYMIVDTSDYQGNSNPYTITEFFNKNKDPFVFTMTAGQTITLYSLLFDLNSLVGGGLSPKLIGNDLAKWQIRFGQGGSVDTVTDSYAYTGTAAGTSDTVIVTYPAAIRNLTDPYTPGNPNLTQTVLVNWEPGQGRVLYLEYLPDANPDSITAMLSMPTDLDTLIVYAVVRDEFGNKIGDAPAIWSIDDPTYLSLPAIATNVGEIVKDSTPGTISTYTITATLPPNTVLGLYTSGPDTLRYSVTVQMGNYTFDDIRILTSGNAGALATTQGLVNGDGAIVTASDTIILRACDDQAGFTAEIHSTNLSMGNNGWLKQSVAWSHQGMLLNGQLYTVSPDRGIALDSLTASFGLLSAKIYFIFGNPYVEDISLDPHPSDDRVVISREINEFKDTTITFTARGLTNCGREMDTVVNWYSFGFTNSVWAGMMSTHVGTTPKTTTFIQFFGAPLDTFNQSDSGYIAIRFIETVTGDTLTDTVKLVLLDRTDYDTVDVMVVLPDSAFRNAPDPSTLYDLYRNRPLDTLNAGDTLKLSALLFDINRDGNKFLGNGSVDYNNAKIFWYVNGALDTDAESLFVHYSTRPGTDTLVVIYGNTQNDTIEIDTLYIHRRYGTGRYLFIESAPGIVGARDTAFIDTVIFGKFKVLDTVYAVIRDEFYNCVSTAPLERWNMTPATFIYYMTIPSVPTNVGVLQKDSTPVYQENFFLIASLDSKWEINGVKPAADRKDSITVILYNYSFDSLGIFAGSGNISNTSGRVYLIDQTIPNTDTIRLTALRDTITLKSKIHPDIDTSWASGAWQAASASWVLSDFSWVDNSSFPENQTVTIAPTSAVTLDTLKAIYVAGVGDTLSSRVYITVALPWIHTFLIVPQAGPVKAGEEYTFKIIALDAKGDTVTDPGRLPDSLLIGTINPIDYLGVDTVRVDSTYPVSNPFISGISDNTVITYVAGTNEIIIEIPYQTSENSWDIFTDTVRIVTTPGDPDSLVIMHDSDSSLALIDTLWTYGPRSSSIYLIALYDIYGNLITNDSIYMQTDWGVQGNIADNGFSFFDSKRRGVYDAAGSDGGIGAIVISYNQDSISVSDSVKIVIIPFITVQTISTHEWVADPANRPGEVEFVLDSVLGIDVTTLWPDTSFKSKNEAYLAKLREFGYMPLRDGYLDYLDITFSEPFYLTADIITSIKFKAEVNGKPDSVVWRISDAARNIAVKPLDSLAGNLRLQYRLWLIPNSINQQSKAPLETGLLPGITFSNSKISDRDTGVTQSYYLGSGTGDYTTAQGITVDSAAPVISGFLLQNNACNPDNQNNTVQIHFSEPISVAVFPYYKIVNSFTLINGSKQDSGFMATCIVRAGNQHRDIRSISEWNYQKDGTKMITYLATVKPDSNHKFVPNVTEIRFAVDSLIDWFKDLNNNQACHAPNRPVRLVSDNTTEVHICELSGNTVADRFSAMNYSWSASPDPEDKGALVPDFPYFGFTVNLQYVSQRTKQNTVIVKNVTIGSSSKSYVIVDYDTTNAFASAEISIFDILGNLVASPATNEGLKSEYTIREIRAYTGIDDIIKSLDTMTMTDVKSHFTVYIAPDPSEPDTLRPIYPATVNVSYDFLKTMCGPQSGSDKVCVPAWNCLNSKGRLVAPGGYIALQYIRTGNVVSEEIKKIIVISKSRADGF